MPVHALSRLLIGGALALALVACTAPYRGSAVPAVPLISSHSYFDHHWYVWLPRHPTYEAAEVMSIDAPAWAAGYPLESLVEEREGRIALTIRSAGPSD